MGIGAMTPLKHSIITPSHLYGGAFRRKHASRDSLKLDWLIANQRFFFLSPKAGSQSSIHYLGGPSEATRPMSLGSYTIYFHLDKPTVTHILPCQSPNVIRHRQSFAQAPGHLTPVA